MSHVIAVDPSIANVGVACFDLQGWRRGESFAQVVGRLAHYQVLRTEPQEPLAARLGDLFHGLRAVVQDHPRCARVYIELPAIAGVHRKRRGRQYSKTGLNAADLAKLDRAIGALVAAVAAARVDVTLIPASPIDKTLRLRIVLSQLRSHHHPLALNTRVSPDLLDAIWLGAMALTSPTYQPSRTPT